MQITLFMKIKLRNTSNTTETNKHIHTQAQVLLTSLLLRKPTVHHHHHKIPNSEHTLETHSTHINTATSLQSFIYAARPPHHNILNSTCLTKLVMFWRLQKW